MAKRASTEDHLAVLRRLRAEAGGDRSVAALAELLREPRLHGIVVKGAAALAEQCDARSLAEALCECVRGLMKEPKRDPGCEGKVAALRVVVGWDLDLPELFVRAAGYRQMEATFGGSVDSAAEVRGLSAIGIAATRPPGAIELLVDLLVDSEKVTRARAAVALGRWRGAEAVPVLRLKARVGDADGEVIGEVLASLLQQDGSGQLDFVAGFLASELPGVVESAALALGQSKLEGALAALVAAWPGVRGSAVATTLLMAISLLRSEEAVDWLLARLAESRGKETLAILDALALYRRDAKMVARIKTMAEKRVELKTAFQEVFDS